MKILLDPMLAILANDLTTEEKATLLMCILEYPNRDCDLGLWKYIKQQIDIDAQKYKEKCARAAASRQKKSELKSSLKSELKSNLFSAVNVVVDKDNINKNNSNVSVSSNAILPVENSVDNFLISNDFSFQNISAHKKQFSNYINLYPPSVVERAERTIIQKRFGQTLNLAQIIEWLEQENRFYNQRHGG